MKLVLYATTTGSLTYVMVATRPDITHVVGVVNIFMHNAGRPHWNVVRHVFRYLVGTQERGILFGPNKNLYVIVYIDTYFASCVDNR